MLLCVAHNRHPPQTTTTSTNQANSLPHHDTTKQHKTPQTHKTLQRLKKATSFSRGDPAPYAALGDVFVAQAELAPDAQDQVGLYQTALQEGYAAALRVRGNFAAGLVGTAEV